MVKPSGETSSTNFPSGCLRNSSYRGKVYKRVGGQASVARGVCKGNDGSWHYYFNKLVADADVSAIGDRRHFSVHSAADHRSVHISMKPTARTATTPGKPDEIMIWYRYDKQWTGNKEENAGWGRTHFNGNDATRVQQAVGLLRAFLEAMTAVAEGGKNPLVTPVLSPPLASFTIIDAMEAEKAFEESQPLPTPDADVANRCLMPAPSLSNTAWLLCDQREEPEQ